jgi:Fic family protein
MSSDLIVTIDEKLGKIRTHPEYSVCLARKTLNVLKEESYRHSSALEEETDGRKTKKDMEGFVRDSYKRLIEARDLLSETGLTPYSISCLGNILEPEKNPCRRFRRAEVEFGYFTGGVSVVREFEGTESKNILYEVEDLTQRLKYSTDIHPVRRATDAHLSLVKIHPYVDGNGRAARLVQDFFLESKGYPAGIIPSDERQKYINLIQEVMRDRFANRSSVFKPSDKEIKFQDFIASKVLKSVEILEKELEKNRAYQLIFENVNSPKLAMRLKHSLNGHSSKPLHPHLESNKKEKELVLSVHGDIGLEELTKRMETLGERYSLKYRIVPYNGCSD